MIETPIATKKMLRRFLSKITATDSCWLWKGALRGWGYGAFGIHPKVHDAHRLSYQWFVSPLQKGQWVHHICETKNCVNPAHLEAVFPTEHERRPNLKTHCLKGHLFVEGSYRLCNNGTARRCIKCEKDRINK